MRPDALAVHRRRLRLARLPEPADGHRRSGRQAAGPPVTLEATLAEGFTSATYRADTPTTFGWRPTMTAGCRL